MKHYPDIGESDHTVLVGFGMVSTTLLVIGFSLVLLCFSVLRENKLFWTNAGGYPIWLRDLVLWGYWPLFLGTVSLLCGLSAACFAKIGGGLRFFVMESVLILFGWGMVTASGYISFEDNLRNVIHGAPVHHHDH